MFSASAICRAVFKGRAGRVFRLGLQAAYIGLGVGRDRGIDPPLLNLGMIPPALHAKLRADLFSNVQLSFFPPIVLLLTIAWH